MDWRELGRRMFGRGFKEDCIPLDSGGRPDLSRYTDSADYYAAMHRRYVENTHRSGYDARLEFRRRVHATWGLIAKGAAAIPHAVAMLNSKDADAREDGASILAEIGKGPEVVQHVLDALGSETELVARDALVQALGAFKDRAAIPILAAMIRNTDTDGDTRRTAVESLGRIVRQRFVDRAEPVQAALEWLEQHEHRK
jgi:HEAT repeats